jgi:hypothetical protein
LGASFCEVSSATSTQQDANRYAYVGGNPINGVDLAGLKSLGDYAKACGVGAAGGAIEGPAGIGEGCATGVVSAGFRDIGERTGCGETCDYVADGLDVAAGGRSTYKGVSKHGGKLIGDASDSLITGLGL